MCVDIFLDQLLNSLLESGDDREVSHVPVTSHVTSYDVNQFFLPDISVIKPPLLIEEVEVQLEDLFFMGSLMFNRESGEYHAEQWQQQIGHSTLHCSEHSRK